MEKLFVYLVKEGLPNLAAAEGHPPSVMDMSFANQALNAITCQKKQTRYRCSCFIKRDR